MTTATTATAPTTIAREVTQARVVRSEWTKFWSLRSTWWTALTSLLFTVGLGVILAADAAGEAKSSELPADVAFRAEVGNIFTQLAVAALAVLLFSGEYGTGMIRSSMSAVPKRLPVLWGKLAVFVAAVLPLTAFASLASFYLGQVVWRSQGRPAVGLGDHEVLQIVLGSALYVTVAGVCAFAIGALLRTTAAGITTVVGLFFVVPVTMTEMPQRFADASKYLPSNAGGALWHGATSPETLAAWPGFALLCGYAVVLVAAATWFLRHRDV
jgi:ABC-2 type transport system permease protein